MLYHWQKYYHYCCYSLNKNKKIFKKKRSRSNFKFLVDFERELSDSIMFWRFSYSTSQIPSLLEKEVGFRRSFLCIDTIFNDIVALK